MPSSSPNLSGSLTTAALTPGREAEIRERAAAATAGPWGTYYENPQSDPVRLIDIAADLQDTGHGYRCRRYIAQTESGQIDNDPTHRDWDAEEDNDQSAADAVFIAHSRQDVPSLLAEVDRLRDDNQRMRQSLANGEKVTASRDAEISRLRARVAELEARPSAAEALHNAADRVLRGARHRGGEWLRAKQVADSLRRVADTAEGGAL